MSQTLFNKANRVIGPSSFFIDRSVIGYITDDGVSYKPSFEKESFEADQLTRSVGGNVTGTGGTVDVSIIELLPDTLAKALDLPDASTISHAGLSAKEMTLSPSQALTQRQLEWFGKWANGSVAHFVVGGELAAMPEMARSRKAQTVLATSFDLTTLNSAYPEGFLHIYDAVSGAVTVTSVPADAATGVATDASIALTFNKPMASLAVLDEHYKLVNDASPNTSLPLTAVFGTAAKGGLTMIAPNKITLTPDSALSAGADYTLTIYKAIPAVDGTTLAADETISFTVAS